jgi:hypothetical protein
LSEDDLDDNLTIYQIDSAAERTSRDKMVKNWRDLLSSAIPEDPTVDPQKIINLPRIRKVIEYMDAFLDHGGGKRK